MKKTKEEIEPIIKAIIMPEENVLEEIQNRLDNLAKPLGSLGDLEEMIKKLAVIQKSCNPNIAKKCVLVFAADNGVVEEGVASTPQAVTAIQTLNMLEGRTGVAVLARHYRSDLRVVDVGINARFTHPELVDRKIRMGTGNITKGPAMSEEEVWSAIGVGIEMIQLLKEEGYSLIGVGEMGIGNTTTSSAVLAACLHSGPEKIAQLVGRGAGLSQEGYVNKISVIQKALEINRPNPEDASDILKKVGGFDLAAMTGAFLGAAYYNVPVVVDGFISIVAALCAVRMNPAVKEYLFASHRSYESGYGAAMEELGIWPSINLNMRLGEGSGCPIQFGIMDSACAMLREMATFEEAGIDNAYLYHEEEP